jgi:hypothetical protein
VRKIYIFCFAFFKYSTTNDNLLIFFNIFINKSINATIAT